MGLFKRLVVAVEKIADKEDDYSGLAEILSHTVKVQVAYNHQLQQKEQQERFKIRLKALKLKQKDGEEMTSGELVEIRIGNEMFGKAEEEKKV